MMTWYDPEDDLAAVVQELYLTPDWQEGEHLEFKAAQNQIPDDLWKTYSAFANTLGGFIVLGVADDGEALGVKNVQARQTELTNTLNNPNKCSLNLCRPGQDIFSVELGGKRVLVIHVPQARPEDRPVYLCGNERNSYKRHHEGDFLLKRAEIERMVRDRGVVTEVGYSADMCIVPQSTMEDLEMESIYQFLNLARVVSGENTWVNKQPEEFLRDVQCYRRDRRTGEEGLTLAGLLMFGKAASIGELLPGFYLDYVEYDGSEAAVDKRWADHVSSDESRSANLFQFFHRILPKLQDCFKRPFRLSANLAREEGSPAAIAAREALVNALIHADYQSGGSVRIMRHPDRLEFSNPGTLLLSLDALFQPHESCCRNKVLQKLFKLMGYSEKLGSGIDKIVAGMWEQCASRPQVCESMNPARVLWTLPYTGLVPKDKMERMARLIGEPYLALSDMERLILALMPETEADGVGNRDLCRILAAHSADISRSLSHLTGLGYLRTWGHGRGTRYCLPDGLCAQTPKHDEMMVHSDEMIVSNGEMMIHSGEMIVHSEPEHSVVSGASLAAAVTYDQITEALNLSAELHARLLAYRSRGRNDLSVTKALIQDLCSGRWLSMSQLSVLLDRSCQMVGREFVRPLVENGALKRRFEDPRHKRQAYTNVHSPAAP